MRLVKDTPSSTKEAGARALIVCAGRDDSRHEDVVADKCFGTVEDGGTDGVCLGVDVGLEGIAVET